ncbi:MAG: hypothetical protein EA378_04805 [Phycisphaerales bacterium]|nr:MAG: hypothetical protein EA378_04805 [Phycisphaerales bacterium]
MRTIKPTAARWTVGVILAALAASNTGCATSTPDEPTAIRTTTQELERYKAGVSDELGAFMLAYRPHAAFANATAAE